MSPGSSSRPPRRDDRPSGRSSGPSDGRSGSRSDSRSGSRSTGKPSGSGARGGSARSDGRSGGRPDSRGGRGRPDARPGARRDGRPARPQTEAERRSLEVKSRRLPREPRDPDLERQRIEERTTEQWIDEGSVRRAASGASRRAATPAREDAPPRRAPKPLDPEVSAELVSALGQQRGARLSERLAQASEALDRERFQESRRIAASIAKEAPGVAAAHEIVGLSCYRLGMYKQAVAALQAAQDLHDDPALLPVIADCQRAQGRWSAVEQVWQQIKAASPSQDVMAEGRIVAAGALADQGDLRGALELMEPATKKSKVVREFHVRQWYVLGDLYDRVGDPIAARRWFGAVAEYDDDYADVTSRLRGLGR
jgi:tetratricopeptide (TPR) repeat protein